MSDNPFATPSSTIVEEHDAPQLSPVEKPWARWIVAAWMFFVSATLASGIGIGIAMALSPETGPAMAKKIGIVFFGLSLVPIWGIASLNKTLSIFSAIVCALVGLFQILIAALEAARGMNEPFLLTGLLVYAAPGFWGAWYLLRPGYRELMEKNKKYKDMMEMRNHIRKALHKRT